MKTIRLPSNRDQEIVVKLTGWIGKDLKCKILGLDNNSEYLLPIGEIPSLSRLIEMEQARGIEFDEDLNCLIGKIISIVGPLHGLRFRYDLMNLEEGKDKDKFKKYDWECEIKEIKRELKENKLWED